MTLVLAEHRAEQCEGGDPDRPEIARSIVNAYLSRHHFDDVAGSCPMIALPSDVARGGAPVKQAFQQVLEAMVDLFAHDLTSHAKDAEDNHRKALAALCVGGMVPARGVSDPALGHAIRAAARETALALGAWENTAAPD